MRKKTVKVLTPVAACLAALVMLAAPAAAAPSPYDIEAIEMRIDVGGITFDTPSGNPVNCQGVTGISGEIDDVAGSINGTIDIESSDFVLPVFGGNYQLLASGTSSSGTFTNPGFSNLEFPQIDFEIWGINTSTCAHTTLACEGTATLTAVGDILGPPPPPVPPLSPFTLPLLSGDLVEVQATGKITSTSNCGLPWSFVVQKGTSLTVEANPNGSYFPLGAIFEQT